MCDVGVGEDFDLMEQIDWEQLLNDDNLELDDSNFFNDINFIDGSAQELSNPSPEPPISLSVDEIEQLLMNDNGIDRADDVVVSNHEIALLADILLESPVESDRLGGEVVHLSDGCRESSSNNNDDGGDDDPVSKKRKRQERNRDAAVKSRERKKLYVRNLEMKSRYFEGECKRLGMLLNCVIAENQALRLSLQNSKAFDASTAKQESAVLLLESLLLGSLLWFLGTTCLLILPDLLRSTQVEVPPENVDRSLSPRKSSSKIFELEVYQSFMTGKRCKASRSRMKPSSLQKFWCCFFLF